MSDGTGRVDYAVPGPLTGLGTVAWMIVPDDPVAVCWRVHELVVQPDEARGLGLGEERFAENQVRPAARLLEILTGLDPAPVDVPRPPELRVVGTCRHFAVLACAFLRERGVAARVRCGFATSSSRGRGSIIGSSGSPGTGGGCGSTRSYSDSPLWTVRRSCGPGSSCLAGRRGRPPGGPDRRGEFRGVRTENWGPAEIRGNAVKDLAALNKVEVLPWDEWGRMTASYEGRTGAEYDRLIARSPPFVPATTRPPSPRSTRARTSRCRPFSCADTPVHPRAYFLIRAASTHAHQRESFWSSVGRCLACRRSLHS